MEGVRDVIGHLVGRDVWTHELAMYAERAKGECCKQLGWPSEIPEVTDDDMMDISGWLAKLKEKYGSKHTLSTPSYSFENDGYNPLKTLAEWELLKKNRREKAKIWHPKDVSQIDVANKKRAFDKLYTLACELYEARQRGDKRDDDDEYWCYEAVMDLLDIEKKDSDPSVWDLF